MKPRDMLLASLTSVVWGLAFVVAQFGLRGFTPAQLVAARFVIAALPVFFVRRPRVPLSTMLAIGLTLFAGQFLLLFFAFANGMPAGLASVTQQTQAFFTVLLAAAFLRDVPTRRQCFGMGVAFAGLIALGLTVGSGLRPIGFALALGAAFSWAIGNVLVKRLPEVPIFPLMVWCSLVPPLPALLVSELVDPPGVFGRTPDGLSLAAVIYLGAVASLWAYATWGRLLQRYSTAVVAPFALIAPCTGILTSALILHEAFSPIRFVGMGLILAGLATLVLPGKRMALPRPG